MARYFITFLIIGTLSYKCSAAVNSSGEQQLYNHLFTNYNKHVRPVQADNYHRPITVSVQFAIGQIESLKEKEQQLTGSGFVYLRWTDELLTWNPVDYYNATTIVAPADLIWLPEITPVNSVSDVTELAPTVSDETRVRISNDGSILWIPGLKWKTSCIVNVEFFPYDTQECEIRYANWMYTANLVNLTAVTEVDMSGLNPNPEWQILSSRTISEYVPLSPGLIPFIRLIIRLKRDPSFFELNVLLPALLLSLLMVPSFILPVESGEKVSLGITVMLAFSITLLLLTENSPRSGNPPNLSILIVICSTFAGLSVMMNVIIINLHHHTPNKPVPKWLKVVVLEKLSRYLCCMNYSKNNNEIEPVVIANENLNQKDKFTTKLSTADENIRYLEFFKEKRLEDDVINDIKDEWNKVARVLDRMFYLLYAIFLICVIFSILYMKYKVE